MLSGAREAVCFREVAALHCDHLRQVPLYAYVRTSHTHTEMTLDDGCTKVRTYVCTYVCAAVHMFTLFSEHPCVVQYVRVRLVVHLHRMLRTYVCMHASVQYMHVCICTYIQCICVRTLCTVQWLFNMQCVQ